MRNKAALSLAALFLVVSGCASYTDPQGPPIASRTPPMADANFEPESLPFKLRTPSGARSGTVEAAIGFNTKDVPVTIKLSADPLLAAGSDYVVWYVSDGRLEIIFQNETLRSHVHCRNRTCYLEPTNIPIGVYQYTIKVRNHPIHHDKTLDPDLDIRW